MAEPLEIVTLWALATLLQTRHDLKKPLEYGNHSSIRDHLPLVWEKLFEDVRRNCCLVFEKAASKVNGIRVEPSGAILTRTLRIINYVSFDPDSTRGSTSGIDLDTIPDEVPRCSCGEALSKFLAKIASLQVKFRDERISLSKPDVPDRFRNVRESPQHAQQFCHVPEDVFVAD